MRIVALIVLLVVAVVFAVQNADIVALQLLVWRLDASLAVIIVLCVALGALATLLSLWPSIYRHRNTERRLQSRVAELEREQPDEARVTRYEAPIGAPPVNRNAAP